jgi:hypothetical protein
MYDPYVAPDAGHAARFTGKNVTHWRCPLLGHRLGSSLQQMGILQEIARKSILGELDLLTFYKLLRKRHTFPRYQRELVTLHWIAAAPNWHAVFAVTCWHNAKTGFSRKYWPALPMTSNNLRRL